MSLGASFTPVDNWCIDCGDKVDPKKDRQELAWDDKGQCRRRCGKCIKKFNQEVQNVYRNPDPSAGSNDVAG
jgi:hypothetical protein